MTFSNVVISNPNSQRYDRCRLEVYKCPAGVWTIGYGHIDALTSFCYNCGAGNLEKLVKGRSAKEVAEKILGYCRGGGKVLPGLERRRKEERLLFLKSCEKNENEEVAVDTSSITFLK